MDNLSSFLLSYLPARAPLLFISTHRQAFFCGAVVSPEPRLKGVCGYHG
ncbi:MAG: hypothetical protein MRK01_07910 [Candidatus Scalindua sp.]|nr:hypothetical protein [Candidatus Scalindua sp.]